MDKLINVYTGELGRKPIARVSSDVGISPGASYCTHYVIHNRILKEGYIGHSDNQCGDLSPVLVRNRLEKELKPAILEFASISKDLDIIIAGTDIAGNVSKEDVIDPLDYSDKIRKAAIEVFKAHFPYANLDIRFNKKNDSTCLVYMPKLGIIKLLSDKHAWDNAF